MLMIVSHHFIYHNAINIAAEPLGLRNFLFEFLFLQNGSVGIDLFFFISAWFFAGETHTLRSGFHKIWKLEGIVFPISAVLGVLSFLVLDGSKSDVAQSLFPILTDEYWYATSYVIFLVLLPFLDKGLRSLTGTQHGALVFVTVMMWGVLRTIPFVKMDMDKSVLLFIYLYVVMTFIRWHRPRYAEWKGWKWVVAALLAVSAFTIASITWIGPKLGISWESHKSVPFFLLSRAEGICTMLLAAGIFFSFLHHHFSSGIINHLAASAFSVYLITEFPAMRVWLWSEQLSLERFPDAPYAVLIACAIVIAIYLICFVADTVRRIILIPFNGALSTCEKRIYGLMSRCYRHLFCDVPITTIPK